MADKEHLPMEDSDPFTLSSILILNFFCFPQRKFFLVLNGDKQSNRENLESIRMSPRVLFGNICVFCHSVWMCLSQATKEFFCWINSPFWWCQVFSWERTRMPLRFIHRSNTKSAHYTPCSGELIPAGTEWRLTMSWYSVCRFFTHIISFHPLYFAMR